MSGALSTALLSCSECRLAVCCTLIRSILVMWICAASLGQRRGRGAWGGGLESPVFATSEGRGQRRLVPSLGAICGLVVWGAGAQRMFCDQAKEGESVSYPEVGGRVPPEDRCLVVAQQACSRTSSARPRFSRLSTSWSSGELTPPHPVFLLPCNQYLS